MFESVLFEFCISCESESNKWVVLGRGVCDVFWKRSFEFPAFRGCMMGWNVWLGIVLCWGMEDAMIAVLPIMKRPFKGIRVFQRIPLSPKIRYCENSLFKYLVTFYVVWLMCPRDIHHIISTLTLLIPAVHLPKSVKDLITMKTK